MLRFRISVSTICFLNSIKGCALLFIGSQILKNAFEKRIIEDFEDKWWTNLKYLIKGCALLFIGSQILKNAFEKRIIEDLEDKWWTNLKYLYLLLLWTHTYLLQRGVSIADGMVISGIIIIIISIVACFGSIVTKKMLVISTWLCYIFATLEIGIIITMVFLINLKINTVLHQKLSDNYKAFTFLHRNFDCCGVDGAQDLIHIFNGTDIKNLLAKQCYGRQGCIDHTWSLVLLSIIIILFIGPIPVAVIFITIERKDRKKITDERILGIEAEQLVPGHKP